MQKTLQQLPTAANALPANETARSTPTEKHTFTWAKCVDFNYHILNYVKYIYETRRMSKSLLSTNIRRSSGCIEIEAESRDSNDWPVICYLMSKGAGQFDFLPLKDALSCLYFTLSRLPLTLS